MKKVGTSKRATRLLPGITNGEIALSLPHNLSGKCAYDIRPRPPQHALDGRVSVMEPTRLSIGAVSGSNGARNIVGNFYGEVHVENGHPIEGLMHTHGSTCLFRS
jgi:hypothetical protein